MNEPKWYQEIIQSLTRSAVVGLLASGIDLIVLVFLVQFCALTPQEANLPSLLMGSATQFFGNRHWVFRAREGSLGAQIVAFMGAEAISLALNSVGFYGLVRWTPIYYPFARILTCTVVFIGFSFPAWRLIFRRNPIYEEKARSDVPE